MVSGLQRGEINMKKFVAYRLFWDFRKEECWLNEMAAQGLNFIDMVWARYLFIKGTPGEYIYRIELLPNALTDPKSQAYIEFMESVGVECMGNWANWVYFRKKAVEGPFELFSDLDSKIQHYKRISNLFGIVGAINLLAVGTYLYSLTASRPEQFSSGVALFNFLAVCGFTYLFTNYRRKIYQLNKEKQVHE
jgi:uncharacterized membrane protein YuzA (DUF378 family)